MFQGTREKSDFNEILVGNIQASYWNDEYVVVPQRYVG